MIMMAWAYFYLLAGIALFIVPEYTLVLNVSRAEASVLMGVLDCNRSRMWCGGYVSGRDIEPRLIQLSSWINRFLLFAFVPPSLAGGEGSARIALSNVAWFILGAGFFAGFYIVPLQSLLQGLSPDSQRGQYLGTANAISFGFMTLAAVFYWLVRDLFGDQPQKIFYLCSLLMGLGAVSLFGNCQGSDLTLNRLKWDELIPVMNCLRTKLAVLELLSEIRVL